MLVERTKMEQRYDAVVAVIRDGFSVREVAEKYAVSRQSVHTWLARSSSATMPAAALGTPRMLPFSIVITPAAVRSARQPIGPLDAMFRVYSGACVDRCPPAVPPAWRRPTKSAHRGSGSRKVSPVSNSWSCSLWMNASMPGLV